MNKAHTLADLKIAQQELIIHHLELEKCQDDLKKAYCNLDDGEIAKEKLVGAVNSDLEKIMFAISHKIRKSVANILGISKMLRDDQNLDYGELNEMLDIIIKSAESLNKATEELSKYIHSKRGDFMIDD
ncbi:hypothetical protein [Flavobacterium sp.]